MFFGEAIAIFQGFDAVRAKCNSSSSKQCIKAVLALIDVSGDNRLSPAEIARGLRAAAFFVGYEASVAQRQAPQSDTGLRDPYRIPVEGIYAAVAVGSLLAPSLAGNLIGSYDFDADGLLSLAEILQDRGDDSLVGAGGTIGFAATQTTLQGLFRLLQQLLGTGTSLFGG